MKRAGYLFLLVALVIRNGQGSPFYDGFSTCERGISDYDECLGGAIEKGVKLLKVGLREYDIPEIDPYRFPALIIGAGTGAVHLTQNYKDIVCMGLSDLRVNRSHMDFETNILTFSSVFTQLEFNAEYNINGKVLALPVHGAGPCTITLENCQITHEIRFDEVERDGETYFTVREYAGRLSAGHARYRFENLFDGNRLLGDNINNLINQEWDVIFNDVKGGWEEAFTKFFADWTEKIFSRVPVAYIFP